MKKRGKKNSPHVWKGPYRNNLWKLRDEMGETQEEMGAKIKKSGVYIHRLECGLTKLTEQHIKYFNEKYGWTSVDLVPEEYNKSKSKQSKISQADMALVAVLNELISIITKPSPALKEKLGDFLQRAVNRYHGHHLEDAAQIVTFLQGGLTPGVPPSEQEIMNKLFELAPVGSA